MKRINFYLLIFQIEIKHNVGLWLSGTCYGRERQFYWFGHDGEFTFTDWSSGQPHIEIGNEHCIVLGGHEHQTLWFDIRFELTYYPICESY